MHGSQPTNCALYRPRALPLANPHEAFLVRSRAPGLAMLDAAPGHGAPRSFLRLAAFHVRFRADESLLSIIFPVACCHDYLRAIGEPNLGEHRGFSKSH